MRLGEPECAALLPPASCLSDSLRLPGFQLLFKFDFGANWLDVRQTLDSWLRGLVGRKKELANSSLVGRNKELETLELAKSGNWERHGSIDSLHFDDNHTIPKFSWSLQASYFVGFTHMPPPATADSRAASRTLTTFKPSSKLAAFSSADLS
jgi:hypothetical protein